MSRRRTLMGGGKLQGTVDVKDATACDVVFYNPDIKDLVIRRDEKDWIKNETPVGIVVIPTNHGVLKDSKGKNQCGVMSIVSMSCSTPTTGGSNQNIMPWGERGIDISTMTNYNEIVVTTNDPAGPPTGSSPVGYIPVESTEGFPLHWANSPYSPSPYAGENMNSGAFNISYSDTTKTTVNQLSDFDGRGNTDKILAQRGSKDYNNWGPNYNNDSDYPAASCCDMFYTVGTKQGDWYLPAMGELGYCIPKSSSIWNTISKIRTIYGIGIDPSRAYGYWSSSENSGSSANIAYFSNGLISYDTKYSLNYVRAFMRL